jgi:hypothetical protein
MILVLFMIFGDIFDIFNLGTNFGPLIPARVIVNME